jgi:hypothetical protein
MELLGKNFTIRTRQRIFICFKVNRVLMPERHLLLDYIIILIHNLRPKDC